MMTKLMAAFAAMSLAAGAAPAVAGGYWDGGSSAIYGAGYTSYGSYGGDYDADDYCPPPPRCPCPSERRYGYERSYRPAYRESYEDTDYGPSDYGDYGAGYYPSGYGGYANRGFVGFSPSFEVGLNFRGRDRDRFFFEQRRHAFERQRFQQHGFAQAHAFAQANAFAQAHAFARQSVSVQQHVFVQQHQFQQQQQHQFQQQHFAQMQMHQRHLGGHGHW